MNEQMFEVLRPTKQNTTINYKKIKKNQHEFT